MSWAGGELGIFGVGPNLVSDKMTGLSDWADAQIAPALTTSKRLYRRFLAPLMPRRSFAKMTKSDVAALVAYLRGLPPVKNQMPGRFGSNEKPAILGNAIGRPFLPPRRHEMTIHVREVTDG